MTNTERAAEVIGRSLSGGEPKPENMHLYRNLASALADAGLLAPDLPEPNRGDTATTPWWTTPTDEVPGVIHTVFVDKCEIWEEGEFLTPDTARKRALALLAAAAAAEKEAQE